MWDDGVGEGSFPVYGGLRVIGSCVDGNVQIV